MEYFLQLFFGGLSRGSVYALIALGYTMVYGILKFINFAHSDIFALGVWMSVTIGGWMIGKASGGTIPPWYVGLTVVIAATCFCGFVGFTIERSSIPGSPSAPTPSPSRRSLRTRPS